MRYYIKYVYAMHVMVLCFVPCPASKDTLKKCQKRLIIDIADIDMTEKEKPLLRHKKCTQKICLT